MVSRLELDEQESTDNDGKVDESGGRAASRKRSAPCSACAARKVKCKHYQNEGADAGSSGQIDGYKANLANHEKTWAKNGKLDVRFVGGWMQKEIVYYSGKSEGNRWEDV